MVPNSAHSKASVRLVIAGPVLPAQKSDVASQDDGTMVAVVADTGCAARESFKATHSRRRDGHVNLTARRTDVVEQFVAEGSHVLDAFGRRWRVVGTGGKLVKVQPGVVVGRFGDPSPSGITVGRLVIRDCVQHDCARGRV